jgi:thiol-disulfide isomerase/thioredoxin
MTRARLVLTLAVIALPWCAPAKAEPLEQALAAATASASQMIEARPVTVAMFASKYCAPCLVLEPKLKAAEAALAGQPANSVIFDQTASHFSGRRITRQADEAQIRAIYERYKENTGFALNIDPKTGGVLATITMRDTTSRIPGRITEAMVPRTIRRASTLRSEGFLIARSLFL